MTKNNEVLNEKTEKNIDALEALLAAEPTVEKEIFIKRLGANFKVRVIDPDEIAELTEAAKGSNGESDSSTYNHMLIARVCNYPDFKNPDLLKKHGVQTAHQCVKKSLLTGEVLKMVQGIMEHNGFDAEGVEKTKN